MEKPTSNQKHIAKLLKVNIQGDSSLIAAAKIESTVYEAIRPGKKRKNASENQKSYLKSLNAKATSEDRIVISAMIEEALKIENMKAITKFDLKPGDTIISNNHSSKSEDVISSISDKNHRIWFKGGQGRGCWPSQVVKKI